MKDYENKKNIIKRENIIKEQELTTQKRTIDIATRLLKIEVKSSTNEKCERRTC